MNVAVYCRVSTEDQAKQDLSLPAQRSRLVAYCQAKDWIIHDFYIDDGYSGKSLDRPEMSRLIRNAKEKMFDVVLVWKLDRLSRRQQHVMYLLEEVFIPNSIDFSSVTENFETSSPMGRAMLGIMAVFAQLERETIVERTKMGKEEAAKQGRFFGGKAILGYSDQDKKLVIDPLQAEVVRKIFRMYLDGNGYSYIADALNTQNVPTPRGDSFWYVATISRLLQNPTYAGYIEHLGTLHNGRHEPIIPKDDWDKVQKMITQNRYRYGTRERTESIGFLRGIVYCGECGARMRVKTATRNGKRRAQYVCYSVDKRAKHMIKNEDCPSKYIEAHKLEEKVIDQLFRYSRHPDAILLEANSAVKNLTGNENKQAAAQAQNELQLIAKRIKKWQDAFETDAVELDEFRSRVRELKERRLYLENIISGHHEQSERKNDIYAASQHFMEQLKDFPTVWSLATSEEQQKILADLLTKVTVYQDGRIELSFM